MLGQIYQCHGGDPELALRCYWEALDLAEGSGEPQFLFPCYDGLASLYLEMGDDAQAEQYMRKAQEVCERAGLEPDSLMVLPFLCWRDDPDKEDPGMESTEPRGAIRPGEPALGFTLPAVNRGGMVSLEDYRGKSPVLLGLFRGLH